MRIEEIHTLVLGAGPSGLAAGYTLAKAGLNPVVVERDKVCGGLMRSIHRGDFVVDVGRKELYNRLAKVDALWSEILGPDYRDYPHRGGILWEGRIFDMMPSYRGFRRGIPWGMFIGCVWDFGLAQIGKRTGTGTRARTLEEFFYQERGRALTRIFSQGFQEKLTGTKWSEISLPEQTAASTEPQLSFFQTLRELIVRVFSKTEVNTFKGVWRHPAKGTGQICDSLAAGIVNHGGRIDFQANLTGITSAGGRVTEVTAEVGGEQVTYKPLNVVSSIPIEFVLKFLLPDQSAARQSDTRALDPLRRTVVLVYLFLDEEPRFPQAWLQVTDPATRIGRITNYTAFNGDMVPKGKTCLCCEYYCFGPDTLLDIPVEQVVAKTLDDLARANLIDKTKVFDQLVLKLPGADASQNRDNFMSEARVKLMAELRRFENLYYVNRTETDIATLAGMEAAEAILSGNRADFDRRADPAQLQIRSEEKAFEFKSPVAV